MLQPLRIGKCCSADAQILNLSFKYRRENEKVRNTRDTVPLCGGDAAWLSGGGVLKIAKLL